jgi:hypothetical protein
LRALGELYVGHNGLRPKMRKLLAFDGVLLGRDMQELNSNYANHSAISIWRDAVKRHWILIVYCWRMRIVLA